MLTIPTRLDTKSLFQFNWAVNDHLLIQIKFTSLPVFLVLGPGGTLLGLQLSLFSWKDSPDRFITGQLQHKFKTTIQLFVHKLYLKTGRRQTDTDTLLRQHLAMAWSISLVFSGSWPQTIRTGFTARGSPLTSITTSMAFWRKVILESLSWRWKQKSVIRFHCPSRFSFWEPSWEVNQL